MMDAAHARQAPHAPASVVAQRMGRATAWGAVSILNATATGIGCSLAVAMPTTATWTHPASTAVGPAPTALVSAVQAQLESDPAWAAEAAPQIDCPFPPSRGLKTSASVAAALLQAGHRLLGHPLPEAALERAAVDACVAAGVTLTGAFDDQVAVVRGGAHVTFNPRLDVLASPHVEPWHVAVWVPEAAIAKADVARIDASPIARQARMAQALADAGDLPGAMTENGRIFTRLYGSHGLPVDRRPADVALAHGALGAGLSGTGPAVAALFESPAHLPPVSGGAWQWTRAVVPHG